MLLSPVFQTVHLNSKSGHNARWARSRLMKSFMNRAFTALFASFVLATLTACGGGGGSPTPVTPTVTTCTNGASDYPTCTAAPVVSVTSVTPAAGATEVALNTPAQVTLSVTGDTMVPGSTSFTTTCNNVAVSGNVSVSDTKWVFTPVTSWPQGTGCNFAITGKFTNAGGLVTAVSVATTFKTVNPVLHYVDRVYATWGTYPYKVMKTGVTRVKNMTQYTAGAIPLFNCWLANAPIADGKILVSCQDGITLRRHVLYIDPVTTDEMYEYSGSLPTSLAYTENADKTWTLPANTGWIDHYVQDPATPNWGAKAHTAEGWFFTTFINGWTMLFMDNQGVTYTVKAGDWVTDGVVTELVTYNN